MINFAFVPIFLYLFLYLYIFIDSITDRNSNFATYYPFLRYNALQGNDLLEIEDEDPQSSIHPQFILNPQPIFPRAADHHPQPWTY